MAKPVIFGLDQLLIYISKCNLPYYKVVVSDADADRKGSALVTNYDKENQTVEDVRREILEYVDTIKFRGGDFTIWLSSKPKNNTPEHRQLVEIPPAFIQNQLPGVGNPYSNPSNPSGNMQDMINEAVTKALGKQQLEYEIKTLRVQNEELKKQIREDHPNAFERVIGSLEPVLPQVLESVFSMNTQTIASKISGPQNRSDTEAEAMIIDALERLSKKHPDDLAVLLKKLADLSENNPATYNMAINFLNQ